MPESSSDILRHLQRQRAQLLARDRRVIRELTRRWKQVERALQSEIELLAYGLREQRRLGRPTDAYAAMRLQHYEALQRQVYGELNGYLRKSADLISAEQRRMAEFAGAHLEAQLERLGVVSASFDMLPVAAFEHMVGHVASGAPLFEYFIAQGVQQAAVEGMMDALVMGVGMGWNPTKVARYMRNALGIAHNSAIRTSRTEMLNMYRYASLENYLRSDFVESWRWLSSKSSRTCLACLIKDGEVFPKSQPFDSHVQCRCTPVPVLPGYNYDWQTGREWFLAQPQAVQRKMVGTGKFDAWRGKRIALEDLAHHHHDPVFGGSWQVASLQQALANAKRRRQPRLF